MGAYIQIVLVAFMVLVILSGSNMVLSKLCNCVNEYISFAMNPDAWRSHIQVTNL